MLIWAGASQISSIRCIHFVQHTSTLFSITSSALESNTERLLIILTDLHSLMYKAMCSQIPVDKKPTQPLFVDWDISSRRGVWGGASSAHRGTFCRLGFVDWAVLIYICRLGPSECKSSPRPCHCHGDIPWYSTSLPWLAKLC